jgi:hypothetical protein
MTDNGLPIYQLRQVLASLIATAAISMQSGEVQIALRIQPAAFSDAQTRIETLSLRQSSESPALSQAQLGQSLAIARIDCEFFRQAEAVLPLPTYAGSSITWMQQSRGAPVIAVAMLRSKLLERFA